MTHTWTAKAGLYFVLLFGLVNLFADFAYEGARSVSGPFLLGLGASGLVAGAVGGLGEFLGYTLRLVSGRWADQSHRYWLITGSGLSDPDAGGAGAGAGGQLANSGASDRAGAGGQGHAQSAARRDAVGSGHAYGARLGLRRQ